MADLHWGKSETFQQDGVPVPVGILEADLGRLARVLQSTHAEHLVVLGDLIHHPRGITDGVIEAVAIWRKSFGGEFTIIRGNHEKHWRESNLPSAWRVNRFVDEYSVGPFAFRHHPHAGETFSFCGHEHPMVAVGGRADRVRLPCFHFTDEWAVLPAFSEFTRGRNVTPAPRDKLFLVLEKEVVPWP